MEGLSPLEEATGFATLLTVELGVKEIARNEWYGTIWRSAISESCSVSGVQRFSKGDGRSKDFLPSAAPPSYRSFASSGNVCLPSSWPK